MALRDQIVDGLRAVFGVEREERRDAESPSAAAMAAQPASMFSIYGRDDIGGLLSVSQILMDRFADYEAMEEYPDIGSTFKFFANDAIQPSITDGRVIWTVSDDDALRGVCDDLMHKKLRAEYELWSQAYTADMYGNDYEEILITENGVVGLNHLPAPTMRRVEALDGSLIGYVQDITGQFTANSHELRAMLAGNIEIPKSLALFEDWQVVHFRLRSTRRRSPYGVSVAEGARWIWKRLVMLEDAAMIYRLQRIPRYAFYVDVTDVPPDRVEGFLKKMKRDLKKKKMVNPGTGRLDMRYKPLAQDEDFIVGVREGRDLARIEVVSAPDWQTIEDIDYFKRMLHGTLNVPRAWLGQDEPLQGKGVLSNEDVRAARVTLNIQQELKLGYERICRVHLAARGMKNPYDAEFSIQMTVPSGIYELAAYEVLNARADYASRIAPFTSVRWVQENVLHMGEAEIEAIEKQRKKEQQEGLGMGMGGGMPGMGGGPPPPMPPAPPGGAEYPAGGQTGQAVPEPPAPNAPQREWKAFDNIRRLEEMRYTQSHRNHQMIMDRLGQLLENDETGFASRERERREFFDAFKRNALTKQRGFTVANPAGRGRGHSPGLNGNGHRH